VNQSRGERIAELEADNRRLRLLLEQRDTPGELRHRLRSTVGFLRSVIRRSAETERSRTEYAAHLEDRLDAIVRAQAASDEHGFVDLHSLLADEFLHYSEQEGDRLSLAGQAIHLTPKAGQIFALAVHELVVNAVEHGALGSGEGRVAISWNVSDVPRQLLTFTWDETGLGHSGAAKPGFGTQVLTEVLPYELGAETSITADSNGLQRVIRIPLVSQVGHVSAP
jgi:two-component sensor histidine kinase